jgi:adenylylsulfate kinase-like enzyme
LSPRPLDATSGWLGLFGHERLRRGRSAATIARSSDDGDNLRHVLNADLGFGQAGLREICVCRGRLDRCPRFNRSPYQNRLRPELGSLYHEPYVNTLLSQRKRRDVNGLYAKARCGEIAFFTGVP